MNLTGVRLFSKQHVYIQEEDRTFYLLIGISPQAVDMLGDVKNLELSAGGRVGMLIRQGQVVFSMESVKSVSDYESPISGLVMEVNQDLIDAPEKVNINRDNVWILKIKPDDRAQTASLMGSIEYEKFVSNS